ncbi:MAG TPA: CheR family methyltransferase [Candidatus Methylomirabilis sp.]|nr:CheR family methyltransferase [Candidatus Methylomirabilis sp.]
MIVAPAAAEIECFRGLVAERLGLYFEDSKLDFLADVLRQRMEDTGCHLFSAYRKRISSFAGERSETDALAEQLTVGETYFFRYAEHFQVFAEVVLPSRMQARGGDRRLRILSAGCASGEEPYSLAILMRERFPELASWDVDIRGFDVNASVVSKAKRARYSSWSLRETPHELQAKYFRGQGRNFQLDEAMRSAVQFEERNLVEDDPCFWQRDSFDAIFCRNVTMYFTMDVARSVVARIARSLAPGGFFFLGHAETLRAVSQEFHLRHTHETFYYQRREAHETEHTVTLSLATAEHDSFPRPTPELVEPNDSWFSAIRRASERIASLTQVRNGMAASRPASAIPPNANSRPAAWDRTVAIELLRREKFSEAMELLRALPAESQTDPDAQLLVAVLLTNGGNLPEAEKVCQHVLHLDELNAGAHYLMALCREHAGDQAGAVQHDQTAAYLDSAFAMPHLHLGLVAKRSTDVETARRELGRALPLLDREDASRILLFGGGFTRESLVEFCRAELRACGGTS